MIDPGEKLAWSEPPVTTRKDGDVVVFKNEEIILFPADPSSTAKIDEATGELALANPVPSSCRYQEENALPVLLATSALRVTAAVVVGM